MPIQKERELTTEELRYRWIIALESGMFKPQRDFLRSLFLGNKFEYRHSPLGVLCVISNLGEFVPDTTHKSQYLQGDILQAPIHHFYQLKDRKTYRSAWKEDLCTPPELILSRLDIFPRWIRNYNDIYRINIFDVPEHLKLEIQRATRWNYLSNSISIDAILSCSALPEYRRLPIIGELLRHKCGTKD